MSCNKVRQYRIGELLKFEFDTSGNLTANPLSLADSIDLGNADEATITLTVVHSDVHTGTLRFVLETGAINATGYFAATSAAIDVSTDRNATDPRTQIAHASGLSRFLAISPEVNSNPTSDGTVVCTIDVIVRGCGG